MSEFTLGGVVQAEYTYNALGQQVIRRLTQGAQVIHAVHDVAGSPEELHRNGKLTQVTDGSGSTTRDYAADTGFLTSETRVIESASYQVQYQQDVEGKGQLAQKGIPAFKQFADLAA